MIIFMLLSLGFLVTLIQNSERHVQAKVFQAFFPKETVTELVGDADVKIYETDWQTLNTSD